MAYKTQFVRTLDKKGGGGNFASGKNAVGICHRSGFKFPYSELVFEPGTNFLVHKSETDGNYSVVNHPQNYPPSPDKLVDKIGLKWSFPDVALSMGAITCAGALGATYSPPYEEGVHLDFRTADYYTRTSQGLVYSTDLATFLNYNRSGIATYWGPDGLIKYAAPNTPRIEYTPQGVFQGLLIETSTTNLLLQNSDFSSASWSKSNLDVVANAGLAPDGTMTADRCIAVSTATSLAHGFNQTIITTLSVPYTYSFYAKPDGVNSLLIQMKNGAGTNSFEAIVDITAVPSVIASYNVGTGVTVRTSVTAMVDGWVQVKGTGYFGATDTTNLMVIYPLAANRDIFYVANSVAGFYIWGAQVEQNKHATSMIPTTTATRSRSGDFCRVLLNPNIYSTEAGTLHVDVIPTVVSTALGNQVFANINPLNFTDAIYLFQSQFGRGRLDITKDGVTNGAAIASVIFTANTSVHLAGSWQNNNDMIVRNGLETVVDSVVSVPTVQMTTLQIGSDFNKGSSCIRTHFQRINYWPYAFSQPELIALTSVG